MAMINQLPDDLLFKILSSLFFKDVIATSILSRRWRSLWKQMTKVKIGEDESAMKCGKVSRSLALCNPRALKSLDFKIMPGANIESSISCVKPAVFSGLRELRIEMLYTTLELPRSFYAWGTLETLILCRLHVDDPALVSLYLRSLKTLHLLSVRFSCDESVQTLLRICPVLKDLVVRRSAYTNVEVFTINVPTLKSLSISYLRKGSQPAGVHGFVINAPSLRHLNITDRYSNHLLFTNMPELVKANVEAVCEQSQSLIASLASVRHLSLCSKFSKMPYHAGTIFVFLEDLELCTCSAECWNLLARVLKDASRLRVLKLKSIHCTH